MALGDRFSDILMEAKRRAKLQGRPVTEQEAAGISEGMAAGAAGRQTTAEELALRKQIAATQEKQFGEQLGETKRQYEGTMAQKTSEFGQQLATQKEQWEKSMGLQERQFGQTLTQREKEYTGTLAQKEKELTTQQLQFKDTLALNQAKFEEEKTNFQRTAALQEASLVQQREQAAAALAEQQRTFNESSATQKAQFGQEMQRQIANTQEQIRQFNQTIATNQENFHQQMKTADERYASDMTRRTYEFNEQLKLQRESMQAQIDAARAANSGGGGLCIIVTTATNRNSPEVEITRQYRDRFMTPTQLRGYYMIAEFIVPMMVKFPLFNKWVKRILVDNLVEYCSWVLGKSGEPATKAVFVSKAFGLMCGLLGVTRKEFVRRNGEVF